MALSNPCRDRLCEVVGGALCIASTAALADPSVPRMIPEVVRDSSGLGQDHLARNPSLTLITEDKCEVGLVLQDAHTLFGCRSGKDVGVVAVEGSSSNGLARGSVEMSSKIGGCIVFRLPREPPTGC